MYFKSTEMRGNKNIDHLPSGKKNKATNRKIRSTCTHIIHTKQQDTWKRVSLKVKKFNQHFSHWPSKYQHSMSTGFPGGSDGKESACNAGDLSSISRSGRSSGEGSGYPHQYSCLENPLDRGAWWATVYGVTRSQTRLSD